MANSVMCHFHCLKPFLRCSDKYARNEPGIIGVTASLCRLKIGLSVSVSEFCVSCFQKNICRNDKYNRMVLVMQILDNRKSV